MNLDELDKQKKLTNWIINNTESKVYWAENKSKDISTFTFTGNGRPDMLSYGKNNLNIIYEVKDGNNSAGIYDAMVQLHNYWKQYEFNNEEIKIDNEIIHIDAFVIATQYSPKGHLFKYNSKETKSATSNDREKGFRQTYDNKFKGQRKNGPDKRPKFSFARTEAIPSILYRYAWNEAELIQNSKRSEIETGIGILLSERNDSLPVGDFNIDKISPKIQYYNGFGPQWVGI